MQVVAVVAIAGVIVTGIANLAMTGADVADVVGTMTARRDDAGDNAALLLKWRQGKN